MAGTIEKICVNSSLLINLFRKDQSNNPKVVQSLSGLVENSLYGVAGNSLYSFIMYTLNCPPK